MPEILVQLFGLATVASAIRAFVPLYLATLGGVFNERSGIVNIGIDGMMIFGTWFGAWGALQWGPLAGLLTAVAAGVAVAALHALATVTFRVDHIVSGVAINILAIGLPRFLSIVAYDQGTQSPQVPQLPKVDVPGLGEQSLLVPLTVVLGVAAWFVLNRTVLGLRLRSAGENPRAAETLGVRVKGMRWAGVLISGGFAGLAGGYLSIELVGLYREGMNQGRGFIALAALILGNWSPIGAALSCLLFAWTEALTVFLRVDWINNAFIQSLPYIVTLIVLALFFRRVRPPKAVGQAYEAGSPV
ncbi:MAG TPA: ABC transporter permease [Actinomycetes bacterium]|nr:ABC transporter permease [Actinomycetota bacterium]HEX2157367.1 ABC transporter permease [Actinomycetes bacterium]